jgi:alpha-tubulin suppressor-like RCC1 family protein
VSAAGMVSSAIKTDGTLWLWGRAFRIGDNSTLDRSSPVQTISGGTNWRSVSLGYIHSGAIREDCW